MVTPHRDDDDDDSSIVPWWLSKVWTLFSGWGYGGNLVTLSGLLVFFYFKIKTSSRHLSARPKVDLAVLVDITGHLSHFR
jgi:hypothetical protein